MKLKDCSHYRDNLQLSNFKFFLKDSLNKQVFDNFEVNASKLTPVRHGTNIKETANEVWHQIFGATNEYLVKIGFEATPNHIVGQGRYLRSVTLPNI